MTRLTGIAEGTTESATGLLQLSMGIVHPHDPVAFSEGYCPNCLEVHLTGLGGNWCPQCRVTWREVPCDGGTADNGTPGELNRGD